MPHFITYGSYSADGAKGLIGNPSDRAAALQPLAQSVGASILAVYFVTGDHDVVVISEGPDGDAAAALSLVVSASGAMSNVETVMAWSSTDFIGVLDRAKGITGSYTRPGS